MAVKIIDKTQLNSSSLQKVSPYVSLWQAKMHTHTRAHAQSFLSEPFFSPKSSCPWLSFSLSLPLSVSFWSGLVFRESFNYRKQAVITSFWSWLGGVCPLTRTLPDTRLSTDVNAQDIQTQTQNTLHTLKENPGALQWRKSSDKYWQSHTPQLNVQMLIS